MKNDNLAYEKEYVGEAIWIHTATNYQKEHSAAQYKKILNRQLKIIQTNWATNNLLTLLQRNAQHANRSRIK